MSHEMPEPVRARSLAKGLTIVTALNFGLAAALLLVAYSIGGGFEPMPFPPTMPLPLSRVAPPAGAPETPSRPAEAAPAEAPNESLAPGRQAMDREPPWRIGADGSVQFRMP